MKDFITDPMAIEKKSMEIINSLLPAECPGHPDFTPQEWKVVQRVIHTTADFEYAGIMQFYNQAIAVAQDAVRRGYQVVTDTNMALAGINKALLAKYGVEAKCFISDGQVAGEAKEKGLTRAIVSMEHAVRDNKNGIFVIGNAPTALARLIELAAEGVFAPAVIIGVPVGFVGAAESKDLLGKTDIPHILTRGRKGGSNVAAAIVNAILYQMED